MSTIGKKNDKEKVMMSLVPWVAIHEVARVMTYGAKLYGCGNWRHVETARYMDALMRHIYAYRMGERDDNESGLPHLSHALCCMTFIVAKEMCCHGEEQLERGSVVTPDNGLDKPMRM